MIQEQTKGKGGRPKKKHPGGRPTVMTPDTIKKLEEAFSMGCSDEEACFFANISKQTLYNYQEKNPEFIDRKEALKQRPILVARNSVVSALDSDPELALRFLERKKKDEFGIKQEHTHSGSVDLNIEGIIGNALKKIYGN